MADSEEEENFDEEDENLDVDDEDLDGEDEDLLREVVDSLRDNKKNSNKGKNNMSTQKINKSMDSLFFVRALPSEYLVLIGKKKLHVTLGGSAFRVFKKYLKVPASAEITSFSLECSTSNYLGVNIEGYVGWRINPEDVENAIKSLDFYHDENPLAKTSGLICDMVRDAVRRSIAEIKVDEILKSSEKLKESIEGILEDVSKWGLIVDTIGINKIYINSEEVFEDLQCEDRNKLHLISEISNQETTVKIEQNDMHHKKKMKIKESEFKQIEIREDLKQKKMQDSSEIEKAKMENNRKKNEISLGKEIEKMRYEYQKERLENDKILQDTRYEIDMKNLEVVERRREAENGLNDREFVELITKKMDSLGGVFKDAKLTVVGNSDDVMGSILAPITVLGNFIKDQLGAGQKKARESSKKK